MSFLPDKVLCSLYAQCSRFESLKEEMSTTARKRRMVLQEREIEEHDWFLGLRLDHQVPLDEAAMDFVATPIVIDGEQTTHAERYSSAYEKNFGRANSYCNKKCGPLECKAVGGKEKYEGCPLNNAEIHAMLKD